MLNTNNGNPRPIPKERKLNILEKKSPNKRALAKNAVTNAGLQGRTIAPKKKPKINALFRGL